MGQSYSEEVGWIHWKTSIRLESAGSQKEGKTKANIVKDFMCSIFHALIRCIKCIKAQPVDFSAIHLYLSNTTTFIST